MLHCLLFRYHQCACVTATVSHSVSLSRFIVTITRSTCSSFFSFLSAKSLALNVSRSDKHPSTFPPHVRLRLKCVMLLADFKYIHNFSIHFSKTQIPNFVKTCSADVDSHADMKMGETISPASDFEGARNSTSGSMELILS